MEGKGRNTEIINVTVSPSDACLGTNGQKQARTPYRFHQHHRDMDFSGSLWSAKHETLSQFTTATSLKDAIALELSEEPFVLHSCPLGDEGQREERRERSKRKSFIEELTELQDECHLYLMERMKDTLELFECNEANSFRESQDDDEESRLSEVIDLTTEEKDLFSHFVQPTEELLDNMFFQRRTVETCPSMENSRKMVAGDNEPANKRKVIRNFFKPKDSLIKDDKTCCGSEILIESKLRQGGKLKICNFDEVLVRGHVE